MPLPLSGPPSPVSGADPKPVITGPIDRARIEAEVPGWRSDAVLDEDAARKLAHVAPGATVQVVLGTWCSDSRREVSRLWKALDAAGRVPFSISFTGVDRRHDAPVFDAPGLDVRFVPTFVVLRDGREVGRIVESAPRGIELELLSLLDGSRAGVISGRSDL